MMLQNKGGSSHTGGKTFTVGAEVLVNEKGAYMGLFGTVKHIRTGSEKIIFCEFRKPEHEDILYNLENRLSAFGCGDLKDVFHREIAMSPAVLDIIPATVSSGQSELYALSYYEDGDDGCDSGTLGISLDRGALLRRIQRDVESHKTKMVLSNVRQVENGMQFVYESADVNKDLYLGYTIAQVRKYADAQEVAAA